MHDWSERVKVKPGVQSEMWLARVSCGVAARGVCAGSAVCTFPYLDSFLLLFDSERGPVQAQRYLYFPNCKTTTTTSAREVPLRIRE